MCPRKRIKPNTLEPLAEKLGTAGQIYTYVDDATYRQALKTSISDGMKIYWLEILGRAHLAASTGVFRQLRWIRAAAALASQGNFLGFSSALRGLLESSADAFDALENVPATLAADFVNIQRAIRGELQSGFLSSELEDKLIHFAYARRPAKGEVVPAVHKAKNAADYNSVLEVAGSKRMAELYKVLCEVTHPAGSSVYCFIRQVDADREELDPRHDFGLIKRYCDDFRPEIVRLMQMGTNPMLLTLRTLHEFKDAGLFTEPIAGVDLSGIPGWAKCKAAIDASQAAT
jgi:hypothetical protein